MTESDTEKKDSAQAELEAAIIDFARDVEVPRGAVVLFAGENAPDGWLPCNGGEISREEFPGLFKRIGTKFGDGDGRSTFTLPDLQAGIEGFQYIMKVLAIPDAE